MLVLCLSGTAAALAGSPYVGVYSGTFSGADNGIFAVYVGDDGACIMMGFSSIYLEAGYSGFSVNQSGGFSFTTGGATFNGTISGGSVSGSIITQSGGSATLSGNKRPSAGIQRANAGFYEGNVAGMATGPLKVILAADGWMAFYVETSGQTDGATGTINVAGQLSATSINSTTVSGSLNSSTFVVSGNWQNGGNSGTFSATRTRSLYPTPPVGMLSLLSPSGALDTSPNVRYAWIADTNAVQYELYVTRNGSLFCDKWFTLSNSVVDSATGNFAVDVSGHSGGSDQWYVRGWGSSGLGPWSGPMNFSLGIPGAVALLTPIKNAILLNRHPALTWSQSFPAASWFQLYVTRNGSTYLDQWIQGATNWTPTADLPAGSYSWWVQTYSSGGLGPWSTNSTFTIPVAIPATLVLVSPTGSAAAAATQRYTWQADAAATWYELYVLQNGKVLCDQWFNSSNSVAQSGSGNFAVDVSGHTSGDYQWYVRGWSPDGLGPWSGPGSYAIAPPPPPGPVTLLAPANNGNVVARQPAFTWTASSPAADWYYVYVVRNGSKYLDQWVQGTTNWVVTSALPAGTYTWWVHPWNAVGYGPWSTNFSFTIQPAVPGAITLVSPSGSVAGGSTQRYTWKADTNAVWYELYVTSSGGVFCDKWYTLTNSVVDSATGNFAVDVSGHGSGTYQWWVRGYGPDGLGTWSTSLTFTTLQSSGMALIPAGSFQMGDSFNEGDSVEQPVHTVYVSAFLVDRYKVTNDRVVEVMQWAYGQGKISVINGINAYVINLEGSQQMLFYLSSDFCRITWNGTQFGMKAAKGSGYPCVVTWYGAVAFCNYRSQMEGRTPCYNLSDWSCNWSANGYRLPTEAEWEKAARGGLTGKRFPWGDTISGSQANYEGDTSIPYDLGPNGNNPVVVVGGYPYTSPVGSFAPNGYGLFDMAGNVWDWCWDWYDSYYGVSSASDPRGPSSGSYRVERGGSWGTLAEHCRTAYRFNNDPQYSTSSSVGFRCVRPGGQ